MTCKVTRCYCNYKFLITKHQETIFSSDQEMEDLNILAADCIVMSCCCECLVLQIAIFVLIEIPHKIIRKTRKYAKKRAKRSLSETCNKKSSCNFLETALPPLRAQVEEFLKELGVHGFGDEDDEFCCIEEVERVLEDLSQKGQFGFGSFFGREELAEEACFKMYNSDWI